MSGIFFHCFSIIVVWGFKYLFFVLDLDFTKMASKAKEMFDALRAKYEAEKREKEEQKREKEEKQLHNLRQCEIGQKVKKFKSPSVVAYIQVVSYNKGVMASMGLHGGHVTSIFRIM